MPIGEIAYNYTPKNFYTRQTYDELARGPMALRQREIEAQDIINTSDTLSKNQLYDEEFYKPEVQAKMKELDAQTKSLSERLESEGSGNLNLISEITKQKQSLNRDLAPTGILGKSAAIRKQTDEGKQAFRGLSFQVGQTGEYVETNLNNQLSEWRKRELEKVAKDKSYVPERFIPKPPPKAITSQEMMKSVDEFVGSTTINKQTLQEYDPDTGYTHITGSATSQNTDQLKEIDGFFKQVLDDPTSPVRQDLEFKAAGDANKLNQLLSAKRKELKSLISAKSNYSETNTLNIHPGSPAYESSEYAKPIQPVEPGNQKGGVSIRQETGGTRGIGFTVIDPEDNTTVEVTTVNAMELRKKQEAREASNPEIINSPSYAREKEALVRYTDELERLKRPIRAELDKYVKENVSLRYRIISESIKDVNAGKSDSALIRMYRYSKDNIVELRRKFSNKLEKEKKEIELELEAEYLEEKNINPLEGVRNFARIAFTGESSNKFNEEFSKMKSSGQINALETLLASDGAGVAGHYIIDNDKDIAGNDNKEVGINEDGVKKKQSIANVFKDISNITLNGIHPASAGAPPSIQLGVLKTEGSGENKKEKKYTINLAIGPDNGNISSDILNYLETMSTDDQSKRFIQGMKMYADPIQVVPDNETYLANSRENRNGNSNAQIDRNKAVLKKYIKGDTTFNGTITPHDEIQVVVASNGFYLTNYRKKNNNAYQLYTFGDLIGDAVKLRGNQIQKEANSGEALVAEALAVSHAIDIDYSTNRINKNSSAFLPYAKDPKVAVVNNRIFVNATKIFNETMSKFARQDQNIDVVDGKNKKQYALDYLNAIKDIPLTSSNKEEVFRNQRTK